VLDTYPELAWLVSWSSFCLMEALSPTTLLIMP